MNIMLDSNDFDGDWAYDKFSEFIDMNTRVTVVPFAFHNDWIAGASEWQECYNKDYGKFYESITRPFKSYKVCKENIKFINYFEDTLEDLEDRLSQSDLVYFVGGFPDETMRRLNELKMKKAIEKFEGIIMGWSAGASLQSDEYYIAPDKYYKKYSFERGLDLNSGFAVQVHYDGSDVQIDSIKRFIETTNKRVFLLSRESAVIHNKGEIELLGKAEEYKLS